MRTIVFSPAAHRDIVAIWEYVAERNLSAAERLVERIDADLRRLARLPGIGHTRPDIQDTRYRFWVVARSFVLAYRCDDATLTVVRVLHGARDFRQQLSEE
jgi:plasmid stabilization system protein ParE